MGHRRKALTVGILSAVICLGALAWWDRRQQAARAQDLQRETSVAAHQFAARIQAGLERHLISIDQIANFLAISPQAGEKGFHEFTARSLKLTPLCARIPFVDPSFHVLWVYPPEGNRALIGFDVKTHPQGYDANLRARNSREPALSSPLKLVGGGEGFALAAPVFRSGQFAGNVICSFRTRDFFASLAIPEALARFDERVSDGDLPVYSSDPAGASRLSSVRAVERVSLGGRTWEITARPREQLEAARLRSGRGIFWTLGSLLALLVGGAVAIVSHRAFGAALRLQSQGVALREAHERLDGAMVQLFQAEKMTALGELVAGVAHEINNPLTTIMGYSRLLMAAELAPEVKSRLETMYSEADRMAKIVKNLLTFARKHPPEKKPLGLNGILEKTLELKAYHFKVNQINVEKHLASDLPMTMLDFHQIQQVFLNLLNNAEQAMLDAGRRGTIRLATRVVEGRIEARVSDDGPGVPPEIQSRIFEPFFTTKKEGKGTGLGLSLCYGILHEHGANIRVESEPGAGATFVVELPLVQGGSTASESIRASSPDATPSLRILVIDDEPAVQDFLVDLMRSRGHQVDTASDVPEALAKIAADGHDLIISDMKMPHGSGKDIYKAVVDRSPRLARRIVFTTGDGAGMETQRFLQEAGNEIVLKPFQIEDLEKAIARAARN
jgi:signal transduction histidine kinase/CheY-like chemotaxis protein